MPKEGFFIYKDEGVLYPEWMKDTYFFMMNFETLVITVTPKLKKIAARLHNACAFFGSDDLYQEALVHLCGEFKKGTLADKTESYIVQGCYFHLKNYMRTQYKYANVASLEGGRAENDDGAPDVAIVDTLSVQGCLRDELHCKLLIEQINNNGLSMREKEVFRFSLEGLTTREIGRRMGVSHVRVVKLRKTMREKCLVHVEDVSNKLVVTKSH